MSNVLDIFISESYTEEFRAEIYRSFGLFSSFGIEDVYDKYIDLLMRESYIHREQMHDGIVELLNQDLDSLLEKHTIKVTKDTSVEIKNYLLEGIYLLQHLENYEPIEICLEGDDYGIEKFAKIISDLIPYEPEEIIKHISEFNDIFIDVLKELIKTKSIISEDDTSGQAAVSKRLFLYRTVLKTQTPFISAAEEFGLLPNQLFRMYLPLVKNDLITTDDKETAKNIFWLLLMSSDGGLQPLPIFQEYSLDLLGDLNKVNTVQMHMSALINMFEETKKVEDEKARLPKAEPKV